MKYLIWGVAALITGVIMNAVRHVPNPDDILFSAAVAALLAAGIFYAAGRLVKNWEARNGKGGTAPDGTEPAKAPVQAAGAVSMQAKSGADPAENGFSAVPAADTAALPAEEETAMQPEPPAVHQTVSCQYCHTEIERGSRFCLNCGKKQKKTKKKNKGESKTSKWRLAAAASLAFALLALGALNIFQFTQYEGNLAAQQSALEQKEQEISELEEKLQQKTLENSDLQKQLEESAADWLSNYDKIRFLDAHVVIVPDDGSRLYHKYGCSQLNLSYFWVYNSEAAKDMGYSPCSLCCQ